MKTLTLRVALVASLSIACSAPSFADKPYWAGHGRTDKEQDEYREREPDRHGLRFSDDSRRIIYDYYGTQAGRGHCPPGLAKKQNGCQPPGHAKQWQRGYPLPGDLRIHDLPREILLRLPPPPARHRYVQVAGDILMIAVGTQMVVDAVEDILR